MLVALEYGILICVSMELQRKGGSQSEFELSNAAWCFYRYMFDQSESSKCIVQYFKE